MQGIHLRKITINLPIELSDLPPGMYILAANGFQAEKIIIY
jgi:hypothetical protein